MEVKIFSTKRSLGIEDLQKIKFHNFTLDSDLGKRCVNMNFLLGFNQRLIVNFLYMHTCNFIVFLL